MQKAVKTIVIYNKLKKDEINSINLNSIIMLKSSCFILFCSILFWFSRCTYTTEKQVISYQKQDSLLICDLLAKADTNMDLALANKYNLKAKLSIEQQFKKGVCSDGLLLHLARNLNNSGWFSEYFETQKIQINYYYKALAVTEIFANKDIVANKEIVASIYNNLGFYFLERKEEDLAKRYLELAITYYIQANNKHDVAYTYINMAGLLTKIKDTTLALNYYQNAINTTGLNTSNDKQILALALNNIGAIYIVKKEYKLAMDYFNKAEITQRELGDFLGLTTTLQNKARVYNANNIKDTSELLLKRAYKISDSLNLEECKNKAIRYLVEFYKETNNTKQALFYSQQMDSSDIVKPKQKAKNNFKADTLLYQKIKQEYKDSILKNKSIF